MGDKICIVTGATSGIGRATARGLARQGATVVVVGRDRDKAAATVDHIRHETGNPAVEFMLADLSAQDQVRRLAGQIQDRYERLHILVNNAGCFFRKRRLSVDGIEMTWAVNLLSPFLLTNLLLESLRAGAPARIVNVSSDMQRSARIDFEDLQGQRRYSGMRAYGQSKLALLLFTYELARRLEGTGVTANAVHPGFVDTNIGQDYGWPYQLVRPLLKFWARSPEEGAEPSLHVASSPEVAGLSGKYFKDSGPAPSAPISYDRDAAQRLWRICAEMTGLAAPDLGGDILPRCRARCRRRTRMLPSGRSRLEVVDQVGASSSDASAAHDLALDVLHRCVTPHGFRASGQPSGYPQVWSRDSAITSLGALVTGDAELVAAARASLSTLGEYQSPRGLVPLNVNPESGYISTENAGAVDANLWFVLAHYLHLQTTGDLGFVREHWSRIHRAIAWLEYQDMNECGLLETPEAGNWMDLVAVRYNTLYDNILYYAALLAYQQMRRRMPADLPCHQPMVDAAGVHERINLLMWIDRCWVAEHFAEHLERLKAIRLEWFMLYHNIGTISSRPFYLPWVAFREYGDWCDSLGNFLAILTGVADGHRTEHILRYMYQVGLAEPYPSKAIHPPIYPGEHDWRDYYRSRNLNLPHQYHNGGIWPMIGGFHVAALVRHGWQAEAERLLLSLAEANRQGMEQPWEFNEWLHGESGHPMGFGLQAWSAGMYLYAEHAAKTGELPLFDDLLAAKPDSAVAAEINDFALRPAGGPGPA